MLELGLARTHCCRRLGRRSFLRIGSLGILAGASWADLLRLKARAAVPAGRARAVIVLWLWGGPSHLDLFDLKPEAPLEYRGPFEPIATSVPGVRISELLPKLSRLANRFALIRSMVSASQDHGVAGTIGLTGSMAGAVDLGGGTSAGNLRPATGSIVARNRGLSPDSLPPYVIVGSSLKQGLKRVVGEGAGVLGGRYDPFRLEYALEQGVHIPHVNLPENLTEEDLRKRWRLMRGLERAWMPHATAPPVATMDRYYEMALSLIVSGAAREVLRLEQEPRRLREQYGMNRFGQSCLLARRMVEGGVPYVQVNWSTHVEPYEDAGDGGWDMHDRNFQQLVDRHGWIFDSACAALLEDLERRGLLESTLVVATGEFGRTPKINAKAGRDHWPQCYSAMLAGAGVSGGTVVGASDKTASHPIARPVSPADLGTTILSRMGVGTPQLTQLGLTPQGSVVEELF